MKAVALKAYGDASNFAMMEMATPEPKEHEVKNKIVAAAFNPVDFKIREGHYGAAPLPLILGADCSGVIDKVGKNVKDLKVGDEVLAIAFGQGSNGTYAEYVCIDEYFVCKKPKNLSFEQAAALPLVGLTAYRVVTSAKGSPLFIAGGSGGVGSFAIQIAEHFESEVYTTAGSQESAEYLSEHLGVNKKNIFLYKKQNKPQNFPPMKAAIDLVGKEMKKLCLELLDINGEFATIVPEQKGFPIDVWTRGESVAFQKGLNLHFIFVGLEAYSGSRLSWEIYQKQLKELCRLINEGSLKICTCKTVGNLSAETVKKAHALLEDSHVKGKLIMKVS